MYRHNLPLHDHGPSPVNYEYCARVVLVPVLLAASGILGAQETSPLKKPPVQNLAILFAGTPSTRTPLPLSYDTPLSSGRVQTVRHPHTALFEVYPASNQLFRNSPFLPYRFTADGRLFTKKKDWLDSTLDKPAAFAPTFVNASYATQHRTEGVEHYIRHIPTAGPVIERIYQQARAHPHFTRALSMFRPDP
jgi:hypothetical protein